MSARKGWNIVSKGYQEKTRISLEDVHYGPTSPGELELKLLGNVKEKHVLEVGCGGGQNSIVLAKWGAKPVGLDVSEEQIKYAKQLARKVFCVVHPIANRGRVVRYGKRRLWGLGNYFDRRRRTWKWQIEDKVAEFYGYGRTFQDYFDSLASAGFTVEKILEPKPYPINKMTDVEIEKIPYFEEGFLKDYDIWKRIPYTLLFKTRRPN